MGTRQKYDIIIVGLGPAGATLARLLDKRFSVLCLDRKKTAGDITYETGTGTNATSRLGTNLATNPGAERKTSSMTVADTSQESCHNSNAFRKPCGGLLAPDAQKILARFGLTLPLRVMVDPQIFAVRTIDMDSGLERTYQRHYINLDRHAFDLWLISLIPEHVDIRSGAQCLSVTKSNNGFSCTWREAGMTHTARARHVVGADGAASLVRKHLFPTFAMHPYLALQQWFPDTNPTPLYSCIFDSRTSDCYSWGLTKNASFILGGAFPIHSAKKNFAMLKDELRHFGFTLGEPLRTEACLVLRPKHPGNICCGGDGCFLLGEAGGFISPSSLEGISYAFDTAW